MDGSPDLRKALTFAGNVVGGHVLEHGSAGILGEDGKAVSSVVQRVLHGDVFKKVNSEEEAERIAAVWKIMRRKWR